MKTDKKSPEFNDELKGQKNRALRPLIAASLTALSMTGAYASEDLSPVVLTVEDTKGTLDQLAGQEIPNTDPVQKYPETGSAYTLTEVQRGGEKPAGDNIITKFTYDTESKTMTPVYYKLDLKQTTYGEGDTSQPFTLTTEPVKGVEITAKYNDLSDKVYDKEYKDNHYEAEVTSGGKQEIHSALQNPEGDTISIDNAIFKDNSTVINFNNSSSSYSTRYLHVLGGAIYNAGTIEGITADFVNNSVTTNNIGRYGYPYAYGGAIYNSGTIGDITGDFIGNYASGSLAYGGAIDNNGEIANITGDFVGNHGGSGGAIYNDYSAKIGDITGDFIGNYASSGGAIYNSGTIGDITGDFIGNYAEASYTEGGAIYNSGTIGDITGDFIGNYASADYDDSGGAIYNSGEIGDITGNFVGNYISSGGNSYGGAIYNGREIGDITGDFVGNHGGSGGAIYNRGTIGDITGDFIGNYADSYGGAIVNYTSDYNDYTFIEEISGNFINNQSSADGGAIANVSILSYKYSIANIENIKGDFNNNKASSYGGAIYNNYGKIGNITGVFVSNSSGDGGAIANIGTWNQYYGGIEANIAQVTGEFIKNSAIVSDNSTGSGGAIYNTGTMDIVNSSFINNTADGKGGAIYSANDLNITASDGYTSVFEGNYSNNSGERDDNAIYMDYKSVILDEYGDDILKKETTLSFDMSNGGSVYMADNIDGVIKDNGDGTKDGYNVNIKGDDINKTTFYMLNDIRNADVTVGNTTLNTINNQSHTYNFNSFTLTDNTNMLADVDLANETMDRFTANSYGEHQGNLNVAGMNLLSDAPENRPVTEIYFAQVGLKDHVTNGTGELPDGTQTTAYTPIYKYHVMYDNRDDGGYFMFTKGDKIFTPGGGTSGTGNASDAFNPSVLSTPVATQAGAYAAMNETLRYAFEHSDAFTQLPLMDRVAKINRI